MEEFIGIPSLFIASLEYLLLVNAVIFSQKNKVNMIVFILIGIYATNHLFEFVICQFGLHQPELLFFNFLQISFLPALSVLLVLKFWHHDTVLKYIIFLPAALFLYYFASNISAFSISKCGYFYILYNYPLRNELGIYYFVLNLAALLFLSARLRDPKLLYKRHLNITLIVSLILAVVLPLILLLLFPSINIYGDSILNKFAFFYVLGLTYFSLKNKTEYLSEKG